MGGASSPVSVVGRSILEQIIFTKRSTAQRLSAASVLGVVRGCVAGSGPQRRELHRDCQLWKLHSVRGPALDLHRSTAAGSKGVGDRM